MARNYPWVAGATFALAVVMVLGLIYFLSVPGGGSILWIIGLMWLVPLAAVEYVLTAIFAWQRRPISRQFWIAHLVVLALFVFAITPIPRLVHWSFMKPALEKSITSGQCPSRAGLQPVDWCGTVDGAPSFFLGGGFIDRYEIAKISDPVSLSPHHKIARKLGDDWYLVYIPFD